MKADPAPQLKAYWTAKGGSHEETDQGDINIYRRVACGSLINLLILGQISHLQYRDYVMMAAREQVFIASELRAHREQELQNRAEANLPQIVLAIHNNKKLQTAADAPSVLRSIRDFYELNSVPVPSEISSILNDVPRDQ